MTDAFIIESVGLVFGECQSLSSFMMRWLRGISCERSAEHVTFVGNVGLRAGSRSEFLAAAAASHVDATVPVATWDAFRAAPFTMGDRVLVVEGSTDDCDLGVAILVSRDGDGVLVERSDENGWAAPVPAVPQDIETLATLALSAACVMHGVRPGRNQPMPWNGRRVARVGQYALVSSESPRPLPIQAPEIEVFEGADRAAVMKRLKDRTPGGDGPARVAVVSTQPDRDARLHEAWSILHETRSFTQGIYFSEDPLEGDVAWVFPGLTSTYAGMGNDWLIACPDWRIGYPLPDEDEVASRIRENLWWNGRAVDLLKRMGIDADQILGVSTGEALGLWAVTQDDDAVERLEMSNLFQREIAGDYAAVREFWANAGYVEAATADENLWQAWVVLGPLELVKEAVESAELVYITEIRTEFECVIAGLPESVEALLAELLNSPKIHVEEVSCPVALHASPAGPARDVAERAFGKTPTLTGPGLVEHLDRTLDLRGMWSKAWDEGVRVFVETGPRGVAANWIDRELGDAMPHLAVSLDQTSKWGPREIFNLAARLIAVGLDVNLDALADLFDLDARPRVTARLPEREHAIDLVQDADAARRALELQRSIGALHHDVLEEHTRAFEAQLNAQRQAMELAVQSLAEFRSE